MRRLLIASRAKLMEILTMATAPASGTVKGSRLRLYEAAKSAGGVAPQVDLWDLPQPGQGQVLVEIAASAVNPSDVKAAMGMMPHAVFPRTPGRDFAGTVVSGPREMLGKEVFGSSGDLGIRRDGAHATHLLVEAEGVVEKPPALSAREAAGIGVPFVTAMEGFLRSGPPGPGETVLVLGLNGRVGQAAAQIASWRGARVIGMVRRAEPYHGHAMGEVTVIDSSSGNAAARVRELTGGNGADIVFNTVGEPYYDAGSKALATMGRQIFIASLRTPVPFDIFAFYRGRHSYFGIDTLALSTADSADILRSLLPGFTSGALKPFPIAGRAVFSLGQAREAYAAALGGEQNRTIIDPKKN
jgi:NADPH:quinone reductase